MRTLQFNLRTMPVMNKGLPLLGAAAILLLAGCASSNVAVQNYGSTEQLAPVQTGSVSTSALPPIGPNGEVQGPAPLTPDPNADPLSAAPRPVPTARSRRSPLSGPRPVAATSPAG
jgi:hypothetical protein